ncbi:MAG: DUF1080 domain-containing protein [Planctomycetaceae bacterium]|nr:DUF1080 domain-containing protein [Planctomycetaceae bacterium]
MKSPLSVALLALTALLAGPAVAQDYKSGIEWQEPPVVTPGPTNSEPPSDAVVLFDGTDMSAFTGGKWEVKEGAVYSGKGYVTTKQEFGDMQLHVEWSAPTVVKGNGQGRGNSGVYIMGKYEVQVLDSYDNPTYFDGQAASIYKQTPPMVNAMRKPGEWNTYDIFWTAPRFKVNGDVETPAYVTVVHNGILVLNHFELMGPSSYTDAPHYKVHGPTGPISFQDHGNPVRFRNIWVRELHPPVGRRVSPPYVMSGGKKMSVADYTAQKERQKKDKALQREKEAAVKAAVKAALQEFEAKQAAKQAAADAAAAAAAEAADKAEAAADKPK